MSYLASNLLKTKEFLSCFDRRNCLFPPQKLTVSTAETNSFSRGNKMETVFESNFRHIILGLSDINMTLG